MYRLGTDGFERFLVAEYDKWSGVQVGVVPLYSIHHCEHLSLNVAVP